MRNDPHTVAHSRRKTVPIDDATLAESVAYLLGRKGRKRQAPPEPTEEYDILDENEEDSISVDTEESDTDRLIYFAKNPNDPRSPKLASWGVLTFDLSRDQESLDRLAPLITPWAKPREQQIKPSDIPVSVQFVLRQMMSLRKKDNPSAFCFELPSDIEIQSEVLETEEGITEAIKCIDPAL